MSDETIDLFALAEAQTEKLEANNAQTSTVKRDERIIDLRVKTNEERTIYFRMFPDFTDREKPSYYLPYKIYSFKSPITNKRQYAGISPSVYGGDDYWRKRQGEIFEAGNKDVAKLMYPTDKRYVNVYIIKDTLYAENDGQFKVMNYGAKPVDPNRPRSGSPMMKCLTNVLEDEDNDITRRNLYSLGKDGVTLKMTMKGPSSDQGFVDIEVQAFDIGKKVQGFTALPPKDQMNAYTEVAANLFELLDEVKTEEVLEEIIQKYLIGSNGANNETSEPSQKATNYFNSDEDDSDDEIPDLPTPKKTEAVADAAADAKSGTPSTGNEDLDELLGSM
jgi:hypothetical protein